MSKKRILIITSELVPFHYGGIGTQFKSLAAFLKRHGHQVYLLARKPENYDEALYRSYYGEIPLFFVEVPPVQPGSPQHFVYAAEVARRFDEIYPEIRPDLVIFADFDAEGLFLLLRSGSGAYDDTEFLLTINGMNYEVISVHEGDRQGMSHGIMDLPDIRSLLAMEDLCVHLAPEIVSPTACAWEEIRQRLGIHKTARIIPNLVDLDLFHPDALDVQEEPREPLILFVGRLDRMKGADLLLKAYFEIAQQVQPAIPRIIFIGRDCFWKAYNSTFLEYWKDRIPEKYRDFVSFLGQVSHDKIRDYLKKATVSVFPSRWEPFGIVCLEALSMGCPVVVSKGTGLEEVLGLALSEFAVPVTEDIQPLAQKILSLLHAAPHTSSEKLRERSRELVRQAEKGWLDLLRDVEQKNQMKDLCIRPLYGSLHQLLASLEDSMGVTLYAGDDLKANISFRQDKIFFVINEETILDDRINFHQMLNVAINSCIRNTPLKPFIIYDGKHNDRIDSYKKRADILDYPLSFAENIRRVLKKPNTSIAAMLKIEIPKILETYQMDDEYVLFADADVLFTEKFICPEIRPEYYAASSEFELDKDIPNNTGFIVINVKGMRNTYEDFKRFVIENLEWLNQGVSWDQHYLNEYYLKRGLVTFLGREFNWKAYWPINREAKVVHFHGPKPTYKDKFINNIPNDYDDTRFVFSRYDDFNGFDSYLYWCGEWEKYLKYDKSMTIK